jgi:hypothetical protein
MNASAAFGSGEAPLNGTWKYFRPADFASAASCSTLASGSVASRRLMIDANPSFLIAGTACSALIAPAHATVVSSRA